MVFKIIQDAPRENNGVPLPARDNPQALRAKGFVKPFQLVEKVQQKLGFFAYMR